MDIVNILDNIIFILISISVLYLFVFALFSQDKGDNTYPKAIEKHHILVLFPAYKEDNVIVESVTSFLQQDYPSDLFHVVVISDGMKEETDKELRQLSIEVLNAHFEKSTKAAALNLAISRQRDRSYDIVVIMDADNITESDFLNKINDAYDFGVLAMQAHRQSKGGETDVAVLDTVSEEINNSIFRKGHVRVGLSSALIGSGMAFDYQLFVKYMPGVVSAGEDKELELLLLRDGVHIEYLSDVFVYDEKIAKASSFYRQRRRWIAAQYDLVGKGMRYVPKALLSGNWDYCNKIFQWMLPPRIILVGFSFIMGVVWLFFDWISSLKWWMVLFLLLSTLALAMPGKLYNSSFRRSLRKVPLLFLLMVVNLFRTKGVNKRFIHTQHGEETK